VLMSFLSRILQIRLMFLFDNLFCSGIKSHISKIMFIQSLVVEMKSERYQFWKRSFENQAFWSKTQHTSFKICNPLIVLYFENINDSL
jgi:hypothetical protein